MNAKYLIAQALITLMEKKDLKEISITDITKKAGISRMSYYRYFTSKHQVLEYYLEDFFQKETEPYTKARLLQYFHFFRQHKSFILSLKRTNLSSILLNAWNHYAEAYVKNHSSNHDFLHTCNVYCLTGALYNLCMQWLDHGMQENEETLVEAFSKMILPSLSLC